MDISMGINMDTNIHIITDMDMGMEMIKNKFFYFSPKYIVLLNYIFQFVYVFQFNFFFKS